MKIMVLGSDLAGLVTAGALAQVGNQVTAVPLGNVKSAELNKLHLPRDEPGLKTLVENQIKEQRLTFVDDWQTAFENIDIVIFSIPSWQIHLASDILLNISRIDNGRDLLLINQSSFKVGTARNFRELLASRPQSERKFKINIAVMPEFISEGSAINDFTRPDRIIVGTTDDAVFNQVANLMRPFNRVKDQIIRMSEQSAEFTKFAVNVFLATRISLINELANTAETIDVDIEEVRNGIGSDSRIGFNYLYPGCGFGGPSFAADVSRLASMIEDFGYEPDLLKHALKVNETQKEILFRKAWQHYSGDLKGRCFAIWGLAFKPNTATIDNAPSLKVLEALWSQGAIARVYDPKAMPAIQQYYGERDDLVLCDDPYEAAQGTDAIMIVTEWKSFWSPDLEHLKTIMKSPVIFDGRNILDPQNIAAQGFKYFGIGRRS